MSGSQPSSTPSVGRFTGFVLGLVVFTCMVLIGAAGYVKYQIDRAQSVMAAPGSVFVVDEEKYEQLRRALGYSGFVGFAQSYLATHDANALADMRAQIKLADDTVAHLPEKTPGESRHDAQAIVGVFQSALDKAEKPATDPAGFTPADMAPLYAALPVLDARLESAAAANRLSAQQNLQFWTMLLTFVSWSSLIIAAALAAGIYLTLRDRNSAPMRALAQSVKNMARGDMRSPIWGMERQDMVGELARTVDLARYNFSQLPDMSLLSEQGPVRLRFEGNTRSLFEAMMRVISRDSEQVRLQATGLAEAVKSQQEAITLISSRVEAVLHNVEKRGVDGDQNLRQILQSITHSAQSVKNAQEHAADQLNRILPYFQERAQSMAEITQLTGKQIAQVLGALTLSERGLRASAESSEAAIKKLSSVADDLGERMFGALNLVQASGKVLSETTEKTQSRLNDAIAAIQTTGLATLAAPTPAADTSLAENMLREIRTRFDDATRRIEQLHVQYERLYGAAQPGKATASAPSAGDAAAQVTLEPISARDLVVEVKTGFESITRQIGEMRSHLASSPAAAGSGSASLTDQLQTQWYQMTGQIEATRAAIEQSIAQHVDRLGAMLKTAGGAPAAQVEPAAFQDSQKQMEQQTQILEEIVATLGMLDTHMQQLKSEIEHQTDLRALRG